MDILFWYMNILFFQIRDQGQKRKENIEGTPTKQFFFDIFPLHKIKEFILQYTPNHRGTLV